MPPMLQSLLLAVVMFISPPAAVDKARAAEAPATQPTPQTQPSSAAESPFIGAGDVQPAGDNESLYGALRRTRVGELVEGKKRVTLHDMRDPLFWADTIRDLALALLAFIPRLIVAGLFLIVFWLIYRALRKLVTGALATAGVDASIRDMLAHMLKWSVMGFGLVIAGNQIGIQIAALLTGVSIIGLAVGFAAKETLENFIAGIVIFWDKPFTINDWVEVDGVFAQVQRVTFRSTRLLNTAGEIIVFPNTFMLANKLCNHTTHPLQRVRVDIGIAYKESIEAARQVLLGLFAGDERVLSEPEAAVAVIECAGSSVNLAMFFWIRDESQRLKLRAEYTEKAKVALDAAGIQIPYPHMQLFLEQTPAVAAMAGRAGQGNETDDDVRVAA
jgi:small conductance mechanosensitive channel